MVNLFLCAFGRYLNISGTGKTPGIALFATNARYKREAYRGSEFAPRILADYGFRVVMKVGS